MVKGKVAWDGYLFIRSHLGGWFRILKCSMVSVETRWVRLNFMSVGVLGDYGKILLAFSRLILTKIKKFKSFLRICLDKMKWTTNPSHATVSLKAKWKSEKAQMDAGWPWTSNWKESKRKRGQKGINKVWMKKNAECRETEIEVIFKKAAGTKSLLVA